MNNITSVDVLKSVSEDRVSEDRDSEDRDSERTEIQKTEIQKAEIQRGQKTGRFGRFAPGGEQKTGRSVSLLSEFR
ncbi:MAG: hypothetical protein LBD06_09795 [Candidatus Accumulibacter sp.]|jgi:hypothetical protein|nr:hypothetical protein [Accumulibacter sp.]